MEIVHRFAARLSTSMQGELRSRGVTLSAGIHLPGTSDPLFAFDMSEAHPNWVEVSYLLASWQATDNVRTQFSQAEVSDAPWCAVRSEWIHGYPEPNSDRRGYLSTTYDNQHHCRSCGAGLQQRTEFRMAREPAWGRRDVVQLNWIPDEIFVRRSVWEAVFRPLGLPHRDVFGKLGARLADVAQLYVTSEVELDVSRVPSHTCAECGRVRYEMPNRGWFPAVMGTSESGVAKSGIHFGSGGLSFAAVLFRRDVVLDILSRKLKGFSFIPSVAPQPR